MRKRAPVLDRLFCGGPSQKPSSENRSSSGGAFARFKRSMSNRALSRSLSSIRQSMVSTPSDGSRHVVVRTSRVSTYQVTPYQEVYGKHPKFFEYNRKGEMQLTDAGIADELHQEERQYGSS